MNPLQAIDTPADLRKLPRDQSGLLALRLRQRLAALASRRNFPAGQERQVANDG
jgi:hypothetical protein